MGASVMRARAVLVAAMVALAVITFAVALLDARKRRSCPNPDERPITVRGEAFCINAPWMRD